jgi:UDP-4-amino-4-deoxy-L-arabinose formyltransferase/UDP-glucuronic acid dehydrogenase (UDP-4-keto-hexauronic acid decarboxylating)
MKIAIIGRTKILFHTAQILRQAGHSITCILTNKEAPEYTKTTADFECLASDLSIPFASTAQIKNVIAMLQTTDSDIGVSFNYAGIIPKEITDLFPLGILNAHGGDLPRYRGNACQAWAILNGEDKIGLCIHRMIGGELDSGEIIARDYLAIDHTTKVTDAWEWLNQRIPDLFLQAINQLSNDPSYILEIQSNNPQDAYRCYPRMPEDGHIDWRQSALHVLRLINALNKPYAGAFCDYEGQKFIIWDAELVGEFENFSAVSGEVTRIGDGFVEMAVVKGNCAFCLPSMQGRSTRPTLGSSRSEKGSNDFH